MKLSGHMVQESVPNTNINEKKNVFYMYVYKLKL